MPKYEVTYYEHIVKTVIVEAENEEDAADWERILDADKDAEIDYYNEKYDMDYIDIKEVED